MRFPLIKKTGLRVYKVRGRPIILADDLERYLRAHGLTDRQRRVLNLMYRVAQEMQGKHARRK
jgi:predicted DNA binding protein